MPPFLNSSNTRFDYNSKDTHPKYTGDVENGVPNGLGFLISPDGDKYVGSWKDGEYNGQGTIIVDTINETMC